MRRLVKISSFTLLFYYLSLLAQAAQKSVDGYWEGTGGQAGTELKLIVSFKTEASGLTGTISIPDSGIFEWPLTSVRHNNPKLYFEIKTDSGLILVEGDLQDDTITGKGRVGENSVPFFLKRVAAKPIPYKQEEVHFQTGNVTLAGTLLIPNGSGPHPAIVFLHGSGPATRNDGRFLGDYLARRGIAALIYDKRGAGASTGDWKRSSFDDLAADALAGVQLLKSRKEINPKQIGLKGQSQGGWLVGLAASRSSDVAFIMAVSGGGVTVSEQERYYQETRLRKAGFSNDEIKEAQALDRLVDDVHRTDQGWDKLEAAVLKARDQKWFSFTSASLPRNHWSWTINALIRDYDPAPALEKVTCPVIAIFGELDDSTPVKPTIERMEQTLKKGGNKDYTIKVFPGADHALAVNLGGWPILAPGYVDTLTDWLLKRVTIANAAPDMIPSSKATVTLAEVDTLIRDRKYIEANAALEEIVRQEPKNAEAVARLGMIHLSHLRDDDAAVANLERAVALDGRNPQYHYWLGEAYGHKADKSGIAAKLSLASKMKQEYEQSIALSPNFLDARLALLQFYLQAPGVAGGSVEKAKAEAEGILKIDPARGYLWYARIYEREKNFPQGEESYRKLIALDSTKGEGHNLLGYFYLRQKRFAEALAEFKKYVEIEPDNANSYDSLGDGYFERGEFDLAITSYQKAIELNPKQSVSVFNLARCYEKKGLSRQAQEMYQRYVALAPKGQRAEEAQARIIELAKKK